MGLAIKSVYYNIVGGQWSVKADRLLRGLNNLLYNILTTDYRLPTTDYFSIGYPWAS